MRGCCKSAGLDSTRLDSTLNLAASLAKSKSGTFLKSDHQTTLQPCLDWTHPNSFVFVRPPHGRPQTSTSSHLLFIRLQKNTPSLARFFSFQDCLVCTFASPIARSYGFARLSLSPRLNSAFTDRLPLHCPPRASLRSFRLTRELPSPLLVEKTLKNHRHCQFSHEYLSYAIDRYLTLISNLCFPDTLIQLFPYCWP